MNTILVPTDFSTHARIALVYAAHVALKTQATLIVLNAYHAKGGASMVAIKKAEADAEAQAKNAMQQFLSDALKGFSPSERANLKIESHVVLGPTVEEIVRVCEVQTVNLVVMGTKGAGNTKTRLLGTNAGAVLAHAPCPVMVVPADVPFHGIHKIVFAIDITLPLKKESLQLVDFAKAFDAEIILLHVSPETGAKLNHEQTQTYFDAVKAQLGYDKIKLYDLRSEDVEDAIYRFAAYNEAQVIALITRTRGFFSKMFSPSLAAGMAYDAEFPMLVMHG